MKTHETRKLSPSSLRTKRHADQIGSAASAHPTSLHRKRPRTAVRLRTHAARGGGMRRGGVWNTAEERRKSTKIWRNITWGFGGLQLLEIPQNRQSFVWKSLEKNTPDLEKLGEMQGGPPLFRHLGDRRDCGTRDYTTVVANASTGYLVEGWIASASPRNDGWRNR